MAVIPKDPLDWLILFRQQVNEIFTFLSTLEQGESRGDNDNIPLVDIFETADNFVVEVELPGFERSDVSLSICCNMLVIEGVKREEKGGQQVTYICVERSFGRFSRTVEIPPAVDINGIKAKYEKGLLSVTFPRLKDKSAIIRNIPIE
ncbi:MAG: Hsp20/alpha crystallin family protein [Deltaproteobacteria bacterium]|nr:MAG: Hsp20/alpha crystallin family protein [Deltaproteobacteria bacterium]